MSLLHSTFSVSSYHTTPRARTLINITKIVNAIIMSEKEENEEALASATRSGPGEGSTIDHK